MKLKLLIPVVLILLVLVGCPSKASNTPVSPVPAPVPVPAQDSTAEPVPTPEPAPGSKQQPISSRSPSERIPRVTVEELLHKMESNTDIIIVDTRIDVEEQFEVDHIKGAVPVPLSEITSRQWTPPTAKEIILYCT